MDIRWNPCYLIYIRNKRMIFYYSIVFPKECLGKPDVCFCWNNQCIRSAYYKITFSYYSIRTTHSL